MGIHGLAKLIADQAPSAIKEQDIKNYFGNHLTLLFFVAIQAFSSCSGVCLGCIMSLQCHVLLTTLGRKIAIDASMCMYQFLVAVRQDGNVLQNENGETTR